MSVGLTNAIRNMCQQLAEELRSGNTSVADARIMQHEIREAEGWLLSARKYLDPGDPLSQGQRHEV
jgi:hypothetical protein